MDASPDDAFVPIARLRCAFGAKFGVPRQAGLVPSLRADVVFEPAYRAPAAFRGLEGFSHIWLLWKFSRNERTNWSPTVRPPRLGGNERVGVFATRSPFRPNPIGLSCVRLEAVDYDAPNGPILRVLGADLADGTPVYDIKPYLPYADRIEGATGGFASERPAPALAVDAPPALLKRLPEADRAALLDVLAADPRPAYQDDPSRVYGFPYAGREIRFSVSGGVLRLLSVERTQNAE